MMKAMTKEMAMATTEKQHKQKDSNSESDVSSNATVAVTTKDGGIYSSK